MTAKRLVHVIDDEDSVRRSVSFMLKTSGFDVRGWNSGVSFLREVRHAEVGCLLLDIRMPEMDGFEVCQSIRQNSQYANIIIIMLTSVGEVEDKIKGIDIGANDYVVKPFGLSELFEVVARVNRFLDTKGGYLRKVEEEKFTTLRGAANTVCHEINNPLTAIVGATRVLNMKLAERADAEELQAETKNILEAAHRIQNITHQLARAIRVVTTEPVPGIKMIDLKASARNE